jgi:glyceraldehyde-3-phosphate dehydrogenase type II
LKGDSEVDKKVVHVVGTGTIGEPLIGLLSLYKKELDIDEVTFHKNTPLKVDATKVKQLLARGAKLVVNEGKFVDFERLGLQPSYSKEEAIERATVVIDCTPSSVGLSNKQLYYEKYKNKVKAFIAQGSEFGFGKMYAAGITSLTEEDQFIQVVSCNTHNIACLIKTFSSLSCQDNGIKHSDFVCIRRASDISQDDEFVPAVSLDKHKDLKWGTHHAKDVYHLLQNDFPNLKIFSSALKLSTQYMHSIRFFIRFTGDYTLSYENTLQRLKENPLIALTEKKTSNTVFSFGRDYGLHGRILNQTVISVPSLMVNEQENCIAGFCFTPQDGNSLLSSVSAAMFHIHPDSFREKLKCLNPFIFKEI